MQAIRSYAREADPVALAWQMGGGAAEIAQLVPEVAERLDVEPASGGDSEEARFRLFDSVTSFLVAAARDRPIVIVLDDLHWADEPSLLLLRFAAREIGSSGLLVVGTYRDVELGRHHPLARVLGELSAVERCTRVGLRGLSVDAVERYIAMTAGASPPGGLAEAVHAQTDGNPFFVGEVVRLLASEGQLADRDAWRGVIPQGVREVVGRRLDRLSEETNAALRVAAAIGREFEAELVWRVADLSEEQLMTAAREAISERLVSDLGEGRYSFSHALVRDTLYDEASPAQRSALHERIGLALEAICGADPEPRLGELAHHFLSAAPRGGVDRAIDYAERAGAQAMGQLAYEEAAELYERALEVLELSDQPDEARRCALLLSLGRAHTAAARFAEARGAYERAAASARALGDTDSLVDATIGISILTEAGSVDQPLLTLLDEALDAIGPERSARRAALLSAKSQEVYWIDAQGQAAPLSADAIEMAREAGDPHTLAAALQRKLFILVAPGSTKERLQIADEIVALGESSGDREAVVRGHAYRLRGLLELGDIAGVDRELAAYARLAEELRMPQHIWHTYSLRAMRAMLDGELDRAEELAEEARRRGERAEQPLAMQFYGVQLVQIRSLQGRAGELLPVIRELAERFPGIPAWRTALIGLAVRGGDVEEGRLELERFAGDGFSAVPRDFNWLAGMSLLAESAAILDDAERAAAAYEELLPYDGLVIVVGRAAAANGPVARILGLLAHCCGRLDQAEQHLRSAIQLSARMGDRPALAQTKAELAELLLARDRRGQREQALGLLTEALSSAREMGARYIADRALELRLEAQGLAGVDITTSIDEVVTALESERPDLRAHAAPDGTVAILFSDIEDSTVLTERLGDERWLEVLREHNRLFREQVSRHGGYEVKSQGDGFMLVFPDPREALDCAVSVQRAFAERERDGTSEMMRGRSAGEAEERPVLRVRMGLHRGEVIAEEGDFFGKNVILAARIAAQAAGGEILVSDEMRAAAGDGNGCAFDQGRELELKGLAGRHKVFRADWQEERAAATS
jgi:class 3 adenylate cyclase